MSDDIRISVELDKLSAESSLRDLGKQLNQNDTLINKLRKSGILFAEDFKGAIQKASEEVSKLGTIVDKSTNKQIKNSKALANGIKAQIDAVEQLSSKLSSLGRRNLQAFDASKLPVTASLRGDNEKLRQQYMANLQQSYQKEQQSLQQHHQKIQTAQRQQNAAVTALAQQRLRSQLAIAAQEKIALKNQETAYNAFWQKLNTSVASQDAINKLKSIKQLYIDLQRTNASGLSSTASLGGNRAVAAQLKEQARATREAAQAASNKRKIDQEALRTNEQLAASSKRLSVVNLTQAGSVNKVSIAWRLAKQEMRESISVSNLFQASARGLTGVIGGLVFKLAEFAKLAPTLASDMLGFRNALALVTGSQQEASKYLNTAIQIALKLKLSITAVTKEYSKFVNAATIAGLTAEKATETFTNFAIAARVLNLNQQRTAGMFLALEQMVSKGTVSMEELRRQLGEHIPGALNLAAQAMDYGTENLREFIKEVASGNVISTELVTNLGELVKKKTIEQLPSSLRKFSAAAQDLANAFTQLQLKLGTIVQMVLSPMITFVAQGIRAFHDWLPAIDLVSEASLELGDGLGSVETAAATVNETFDILTDTQKSFSTIAIQSKDNLQQLTTEMNAASLASIALIGTVGTAGLGGAFAAIGKSLKLIRAGLANFFAPLIAALGPLKSLAKLLGKGGLTGLIFNLKLAFQGLMLTIQATIARMAVLVLMNPWVAITTAIAAATAGLYLYLDGNKEIEKTNANINKTFNEASKKSEEFKKVLQDIIVKMADIGQTDLAVRAAKVEDDRALLERRAAILERQRQSLNSQLGFWDDIASKVGITTTTTERVERQLKLVEGVIAATNAELIIMRNRVQEVHTEASLVTQQFEKVKEIIQNQINNAKLDELKIRISMVGQEDYLRDLALLEAKRNKAVNEAQIEFGVGTRAAAEASALIDAEYKLERQLILTSHAFNQNKKAMDDFNAALKSVGSSIETAQRQLEQQVATFGKQGLELDRLNASFKIAALEEKLLEAETKATTAAMKAKVVAMREQIATTAALYEKVNLLKEAERQRQALLKMQEEDMQREETLRKKGIALLQDSLPLNQQYALRIQEISKALDAAGATHEQKMKIFRDEWVKLVDASNTGLKSMEALTEEFAKGMKQNFSDFFFDAMKGDFNDLGDAFTSMLNRMVSDAIATNLSQYILGGGSGGGGIFDSILNSQTVSSLFNLAGPAPAAGASTLVTGGGFHVNLPGFASGGDFRVGGTGGVDSQVVAFKASPNETVSVRTPKQQSEMGNKTFNVSMSISTPNADSFFASKGQIEYEIRQMVMNAARNA